MDKLKRSKKKLLVASLALVITMALTATSTFAWFSMNTEATVDFDLSVTADTGIQIAIVPYLYDYAKGKTEEPKVNKELLTYYDDITLANFPDLNKLFLKHQLVPSSYGDTLVADEFISEQLQQLSYTTTAISKTVALAPFTQYLLDTGTQHKEDANKVYNVPYVKFRIYMRATQGQEIYVRNGQKYDALNITDISSGLNIIPVTDFAMFDELFYASSLDTAGYEDWKEDISIFPTTDLSTDSIAGGTLTYVKTDKKFVVAGEIKKEDITQTQFDENLEAFVYSRMNPYHIPLYEEWLDAEASGGGKVGSIYKLVENTINKGITVEAEKISDTEAKYSIIFADGYEMSEYNEQSKTYGDWKAIMWLGSLNSTPIDFPATFGVAAADEFKLVNINANSYFTKSAAGAKISYNLLEGYTISGVNLSARTGVAPYRVAFEGEGYNTTTPGDEDKPSRFIYDPDAGYVNDKAEETNVGWIYFAYKQGLYGQADLGFMAPSTTSLLKDVPKINNVEATAHKVAVIPETQGTDVYTYSYVDVTVWLEGFDGECFESIVGFKGSFKFNLTTISPYLYAF